MSSSIQGGINPKRTHKRSNPGFKIKLDGIGYEHKYIQDNQGMLFDLGIRATPDNQAYPPSYSSSDPPSQPAKTARNGFQLDKLNS